MLSPKHTAPRRALLIGFLLLAFTAAASAFAGIPASPHSSGSGRTPDQLQALVDQDCGSCHGLTRRGGLGSPLIATALAGKDETGLMAVILDGISGTPMPAWRGILTETEALWIVRHLKTASP